MLEIKNPKHGFIVKYFIQDGQTVVENTPLFSVDIEDELIDVARNEMWSKLSNVATERFSEAEVNRKRKNLNLALLCAESHLDLMREILVAMEDRFRAGVGFEIDVKRAKQRVVIAEADLEKGKLAVESFEHATALQIKSLQIMCEQMAQEVTLSKAKIERMTVMAPIAGVASIKVPRNSFAVRGQCVVSIT